MDFDEPLITNVDYEITDIQRQSADMIDDALKGRKIVPNLSRIGRHLYDIHHGRIWAIFYDLFCALILSLTIVEKPNTYNVYSNFHYKIFPYGLVLTLQGFCYCFFWIDLLLELKAYPSRFWISLRQNKWSLILFIVLFSMSLNWFLSLFLANCPDILRILRPLFIIKRRRNIRRIFSGIIMILPELLNIIIALVILLLFFAMMAISFFGGMSNDQCTSQRPIPYTYCSVFRYDDCTNYFGSLDVSLVNLYTLLTTANSPDVMLPVYRCNRLFSLFFIVFQLIGMYCLFSLVTATVNSNFQNRSKTKLLYFYKKVVGGLESAFLVLTKPSKTNQEDYIVTKRDYIGMMRHYNPELPSHLAGLCYDIYDTDNNEEINNIQFYSLVYIYSKITALKQPTRAFDTKYSRYASKIRSFTNHFLFSIFYDICIIINTVFIVVENGDTSSTTHNRKPIYLYMQILFTILFTAELIIKLIALGFRKYWKNHFHKIDLISLMGVYLGYIFQFINLKYEYEIIKIFFLLRILRLFRLLRFISGFTIMGISFKYILPAFSRYIIILICLYYFYSVLGMELFYGKLHINDIDVRNSSFGQLNYTDNNFDDILTSMVTLWTQMVVNNWPIVMEGVVAGTKTKLSQIYFIVWNLLSVNIVLKILLSFFLETYTLIYNKQSSKGKIEDPWLSALRDTASKNRYDLDEWIITKPTQHGDIYEVVFGKEIFSTYKQLQLLEEQINAGNEKDKTEEDEVLI